MDSHTRGTQDQSILISDDEEIDIPVIYHKAGTDRVERSPSSKNANNRDRANFSQVDVSDVFGKQANESQVSTSETDISPNMTFRTVIN